MRAAVDYCQWRGPRFAFDFGIVRDCVLITGVCVFTFASYAGKLGFYSDDWGMFADLSTVRHPSILACFAALSTHERQMQMRPVQIFYFAALYRLFGNRAIAYHLTNSLIVCLVSVLLYLVCRKVLSRLDSLAVALIYSLLPHYSTARFWFASFQAPMSCALCLLAVLAMLNAAGRRGTPSVLWLLLASVSAALSVLAYEVTFGLMLLIPVLVKFSSSNFNSSEPSVRYRSLRLYLPFAGALSAAMSYKIAVETRYYSRHSYNVLRDFGPIARAFAAHLIEFDFGRFALEVPYTAWQCLHLAPSGQFVFTAAALGALVFAYIRKAGTPVDRPPVKSAAACLIAFGLLTSIMGLAWFFADKKDSFIATGADNRITIAAAIGASAVVAGCAGLFSNLFGQANRAAIFAFFIAVLCGSNYLIVSTIAQYWIAAGARQSQVLAAVHRALVRAPVGSTVLVAGFCPYIGPGIVFESTWDMTGVLQLSYGDDTLRGDVVNSHAKLARNGVITQSYDENSYGFNDLLLLVDVGTGEVDRLNTSAAAKQTLLPKIKRSPCPWAKPGRGLPVL